MTEPVTLPPSDSVDALLELRFYLCDDGRLAIEERNQSTAFSLGWTGPPLGHSEAEEKARLSAALKRLYDQVKARRP